MSISAYNSIFDIIGPVMIGPSSSHTAGAARIGKVVRNIFGEAPAQVDIYLYESFAKTYRGHGTDIALAGGLLGMNPDDPHLSDSLTIAKNTGMEINFIPTEENAEHPNTARLFLKNKDQSRTLSVVGVSIGGGSIAISEINGFKIQLSLGTPTFVVVHQDVPGVIANVTQLLFEQFHINIATMSVSRESKGENAIMVIEVDQPFEDNQLHKLQQLPDVYNVSYFD